MSQFGLHHVIEEPTHILDNSSSCIDLKLALLRDLIIESGVHPYLHQNYHQQIIYAKFNAKFIIHHKTMREV